MNKYGLHGKLTASAGNRDALASILLEASKLVASAPGCQVYLISTDVSDKNSVWVTEVWDSQADHDDSLKDQRVRELISKAMPLLAGSPEKGQTLTVLGGAGIK
ncbi:MAG: antibiotic biosynthesis monooxygenase [Bacteroidota bacterium]